jgi:hypothetical protein
MHLDLVEGLCVGHGCKAHPFTRQLERDEGREMRGGRKGGREEGRRGGREEGRK